MELRHLRYFVALAEQLSFTRAAARVHVTQSTLSHQIRQLEEEIGQQLFDRIGKKVVTTEAGELFLGFALRALKEVDQGIAMLKPGSGGLTGQVRVGATHTFNIGLIPECVALFLARHPTVRVRVDELAADEIGEKLRAGELDLGIAYRPNGPTDLWFEPLYNEEMVLVVATSHPLAGRKRIRMVELHQQRLVLLPEYFATRTLLEECFKASGAEPIVIAEFSIDRADARPGAAHGDRRDRRDQRRAGDDERPGDDPDREPDADPHARGCSGASRPSVRRRCSRSR